MTLVWWGVGGLLTLASAVGALALTSIAIARSRPLEELLIITAVTAVAGFFCLRQVLAPLVATWGYAILLGVIAVNAIIHAAHMWPDYKAVTIIVLATCLLGYLCVFIM